MVAPLRRFAAGGPAREVAEAQVRPALNALAPREAPRGAVSRLVGATGKISLGGCEYRVGAYLVGESVVVCVSGHLVEVRHRNVLVASDSLKMRIW